MADLGANEDDVRFDHGAARRLVVQFRLTATELENQVGWRTALAGGAKQEWRGAYSEKFDIRVDQCIRGAVALAASMWRTAAEIEKLAGQANQEQARREAARQWVLDQQNRNLLEKVGDGLHDVVFGDDGPPRPDPIEPTPIDVGAVHQSTANRG